MVSERPRFLHAQTLMVGCVESYIYFDPKTDQTKRSFRPRNLSDRPFLSEAPLDPSDRPRARPVPDPCILVKLFEAKQLHRLRRFPTRGKVGVGVPRWRSPLKVGGWSRQFRERVLVGIYIGLSPFRCLETLCFTVLYVCRRLC